LQANQDNWRQPHCKVERYDMCSILLAFKWSKENVIIDNGSITSLHRC
jgi:hypothetical protein